MNCAKIKPDGRMKCPPTIPVERSKKSHWVISCFAVPLIGGAIPLVEDSNGLLFTCASTTLCIVIFGALELVKRTCLLMEERKHLLTRYNNSKTHMLMNAYSMRIHSILIIFTSALLSIFFCWQNGGYHYKSNALPMICVVFGVHLLLQYFNFHDSPLYDSLRIAEMKGMDYGSGLAHSFFHGYLNLVLPPDTKGKGGLKEAMVQYEDKENVKFACQLYKLYVLVPMSMHCPSLLAAHNIETAKSSEDIVMDRAGVKNRVYKNSFYKINYRDSNYYVCAEYATPIKTLSGVVDNSRDRSAPYYKEHVKDIVLQFYLTCNRLINENDEIRNLCELIYFEDRNEADVGSIIMENVIRGKMKSKSK